MNAIHSYLIGLWIKEDTETEVSPHSCRRAMIALMQLPYFKPRIFDATDPPKIQQASLF